MSKASQGIVCRFCDKVFTDKRNCNRHVKAIHEVNADGEKIVNRIITCVFCDKKFVNQFNLKRHLNVKHLCDQTNSKMFKCQKCNYCTHNKQNYKRHVTSFNHENKLFLCSLCNARYTNERGVKRHKQKVHFSKKVSVNKKMCPLCKFNSKNRSLNEMYSHFENTHGIILKWEKHNFTSLIEFKKWKEEVEILTTSSFVKLVTNKNVHIYRCHRCGMYKNRGKNKRNTKIMKSSKIDGFCPARIIVKVKQDNDIEVSFLKSHVGHKNELKHKRLTQEERKSVAIKLALKVPADQILTDLRSTLTNCDLQRIHLINKRDIRNIEKSFNLGNEALKDSFDPVSVQAWVETLHMSPSTSFVFYKPQGVFMESEPNLDTDDFVLMFMTKSQEEMLKKCGKDVICMDSTDGTNNYDFQLYTVMVMDETREGFPVAFLISNKGDLKIFSVFMEKIKEQVGSVKCKVFMSDMENTFYSSWEKIMGPTTQLYCSWHVLRAWKKNARSKIKNKDKQEDVFKILKGLLYELNITTFHKILEAAITKMNSDEETCAFGNYFLENYVQKEMFKRWSYCYRMNTGINTNMSIENFNKLLKYCYLKGKKTKRLDKTLCALLNLLKDKLFDLIIKNQKGEIVKKLQVLRRRHKDSYKLSEESVIQDVENEWHVLSSTCNDIYSVKRIASCVKCLLICDHCNSCFHEYICSCMDSSIRSNMCEHIHLVARLTKVDVGPLQNIDETDSLIVDETEELIDTNIIINELNSENKKCDEKFEDSLQDFFNFIAKNVHNMEELNFAKKKFDSLLPTLEAMRKTKAVRTPNEMEQFPPNSKAVTQRCFVSSKEQRNVENTKQDLKSHP